MDNTREQTAGRVKFSLDSILKDTVSKQTPRFYEESNLHELLCLRYNLSRHAAKDKLIDLVTQELNI